MQPFLPDLALLLRPRIIRIKKRLPVYTDHTAVGLLQKIQAPQQRSLAASR